MLYLWDSGPWSEAHGAVGIIFIGVFITEQEKMAIDIFTEWISKGFSFALLLVPGQHFKFLLKLFATVAGNRGGWKPLEPGFRLTSIASRCAATIDRSPFF